MGRLEEALSSELERQSAAQGQKGFAAMGRLEEALPAHQMWTEIL